MLPRNDIASRSTFFEAREDREGHQNKDQGRREHEGRGDRIHGKRARECEVSCENRKEESHRSRAADAQRGASEASAEPCTVLRSQIPQIQRREALRYDPQLNVREVPCERQPQRGGRPLRRELEQHFSGLAPDGHVGIVEQIGRIRGCCTVACRAFQMRSTDSFSSRM